MKKLELLASGPGTGKTTYCIDLFRKEILKSPAGLDSRAYFVLPNREHASRIQNLVLKKGVDGLFNVHILTFQELETRLLGGSALPRPGETMRRSVLRFIVEDPSEKWETFESVKDLPGFYELLSERVQEFRQSSLDADGLEERAKAVKGDAVFRSKAADFVRLLRRYDRELSARGFSDAPPSGRALRPGAEEAPSVILDGFYHFTRSQKTLIEALAKGGARMTVTLTLPASCEKRAHVFELVLATKAFLEKTGFKASEASLTKNHRIHEQALLHLERSLFLPRPGKLTGTQKAVHLITAETVHDEIEAIARQIRCLHRDTKWHFSDMALILRSLKGYEKSIASVFREYEIPVSVHERKRTVETGLGRFIRTLLTLFLEDWPAPDLLSTLKSVYFPFRFSAEGQAALERFIFQKNIRGGREAWKALTDPSVQEAAQAAGTLAAFEEKLTKTASARAFRLAFAAFLRSLPLDTKDGDSGAARAIEQLLIRVESGSSKTFSAPRAVEELRDALDAALFSEKPEGKNRVQVYDAVMALPKEYRIVFAAGLLDGRFPQPVNEDPFFKDEERRMLNGKNAVLELRSPRRSGERYFFYMAATRARNMLYLSYPQKDRDGKPYLPSVFAEEARRCFADLPVIESGPDRKTSPKEWTARLEAEKAAAEALFAPQTSLKETEKKELLAFASLRKKETRFARILEAGRDDGQARFTDPRAVEAVRAEASVFSASRLETFLTCSFKYFADYTLKLKPYLEDRLRAETGTLLHGVLEDYYARGRSEKQLFGDLEKGFAKSPLASEPLFRQAYLLERARRTLGLFLKYEKKVSESGFKPAHFELAFGKKRDGSPAELPSLKVGKEGVLVNGFIDRVDVSPDGKGALVIDYKLSTRPLRKKLNEGLEVQLPLYLLAARDLLGLEPLGAELRFLESGTKSALKPEELDALLKATEARVMEAARRIREGDIAVRSKSCQYCNFSTLCRFEPWRLVYAEVDRA